MAGEKILVIEDETKIARVLKLELEHEGYSVSTATTGTQGLATFQEQKWDLVLLDVMLPELNGLEVLRRIRTTGDATPVILLTARDSIPDKVSGLDQGANDYITKPFQIEELLARIRVCLRVQTRTDDTLQKQELRIADLSVDEIAHTVTRRGKEIELTPKEFNLLVFLLKHQNQVLQREQIVEHVWGYDFLGDTNVVDVYIRYLRKKVDQPFDVPLIHTVRGVGYVIKE
ncbi:response regulator transcription factor [Bacillus alkalicellulosilyticus]|uniref:response regulator transcription factor n=1 Tax=Alkalihalobacterium alkalicellulosilyticum TaxID=1912214 RepID=UPI00099711FA|nr:response regulator transcription factor [Bacillus alkalicellulosilyticus]